MEPHDTVRRYADAWAANDVAAVFDTYHEDFVLDTYHEDFVLHYFGDSPLAGDHIGKEAAIRVLVEATQRSGRQLDQIEDVMAGTTFGAIVAREGIGHGDEMRVIRRVFLYRVRDAKLAECWLYDEDQRTIDELWSTAAN